MGYVDKEWPVMLAQPKRYSLLVDLGFNVLCTLAGMCASM